MSYLHSQDVVHGDLKGANILIDRYGNAVVADFGGSAIKKKSNTATKVLGAYTLHWAAPERIAGKKIERRLTFAADVYSFAATCCEVFSGGALPLFKSEDGEELFDYQISHAVIHERRRPARPKDLPDGLWEIVEISWHEEPRNRPSFDGVIESLSNLLSEPQSFVYVDRTVLSDAPPLAAEIITPSEEPTRINLSGTVGDRSLSMWQRALALPFNLRTYHFPRLTSERLALNDPATLPNVPAVAPIYHDAPHAIDMPPSAAPPSEFLPGPLPMLDSVYASALSFKATPSVTSADPSYLKECNLFAAGVWAISPRSIKGEEPLTNTPTPSHFRWRFFRATWKEKVVVVKRLKSEPLAGRLTAMAEALDIGYALDHENILPLFGAGLDSSGLPFLVVPHMSGGTINHYLTTVPAEKFVQTALGLLTQTCY
ncbi:kinase-like domain-containing protein, partial [Blyttiomyces helicus]